MLVFCRPIRWVITNPGDAEDIIVVYNTIAKVIRMARRL